MEREYEYEYDGSGHPWVIVSPQEAGYLVAVLGGTKRPLQDGRWAYTNWVFDRAEDLLSQVLSCLGKVRVAI